MPNLFNDEIIKFNQYDIDLNRENIFDTILNIRKYGFDRERFFLNYITDDVLANFDFNDTDSLNEFRNLPTYPYKLMGGCNVMSDMLQKDIRYAGIKISDPSRNILGQFDIRNHVMTYSPIFPYFFDERDLCKFARDDYFTTFSFFDIFMNQVNYCTDYYVHVGNYMNSKDFIKYGKYKFEKISKDKMIEYATDSELGKSIVKKYNNWNF